MAATSNLIGTGFLLVALTLNALGWFWTHRRIDLLALRNDVSVPSAAPQRVSPNSTPSPPATSAAPADAAGGRDMSQPAHFEVAGIAAPILLRPDEAALDDDEKVIGVTADGEARAYVLKAFEAHSITKKEDLAVHIVNDMIGNQPICVTHCDRTHSTRVLTTDSEAGSTPQSVDVRIGGWGRGLVLLVEGIRYDHHSPALPLVDVEFVNTTWGKWRADHPETLVYTRD